MLLLYFFHVIEIPHQTHKKVQSHNSEAWPCTFNTDYELDRSFGSAVSAFPYPIR